MLEAGAINNKLGFVESGYFMNFIQSNLEIKATSLITENEFVVSLSSYLMELPSHEYIRCISTGIVLSIAKSDIQILLMKYRISMFFTIK